MSVRVRFPPEAQRGMAYAIPLCALPLSSTPLPSGEGTRAEALGRLCRLPRSHPSLCFYPSPRPLSLVERGRAQKRLVGYADSSGAIPLCALPLSPTPLPSGEGTRAEALGRLCRLPRSHPSLCFTPHLVSGKRRFAHGIQLFTGLCAKESHSRTGFGHGASTGWRASTGSATGRTTVTGDGKLSERVWAGNTSGGYFRKTKKTARMRQRKAAM